MNSWRRRSNSCTHNWVRAGSLSSRPKMSPCGVKTKGLEPSDPTSSSFTSSGSFQPSGAKCINEQVWCPVGTNFSVDVLALSRLKVIFLGSGSITASRASMRSIGNNGGTGLSGSSASTAHLVNPFNPAKPVGISQMANTLVLPPMPPASHCSGTGRNTGCKR